MSCPKNKTTLNVFYDAKSFVHGQFATKIAKGTFYIEIMKKLKGKDQLSKVRHCHTLEAFL